jgi:DNA modification methylase
MKRVKLYQGDNIESLKKLPNNSIDSIVSDPPYGISFMNRKWDYDVPSVEFWSEVYRVLKPGGHVLSFGGTRTYHRMVVNIEDAGFEIRDQIMWLYGSGFPKSHNIGKAIDSTIKTGKSNPKAMREVRMGDDYKPTGQKDYKKGRMFGNDIENDNTEQTINNEWEGWGTALKPANEPICVARKPLSEKSVAENVLKWGTGGINIDGCRVGSEVLTHSGCGKSNIGAIGGSFDKGTNGDMTFTSEGRFPANIILECICDEVIKGEKGEVKKTNRDRKYEVGDDKFGITKDKSVEGIDNYNDKGDIHTNPMCPCYLMDEQSGVSKSSKGLMKSAQSGNDEGRYNWNNGDKNDFQSVRGHNDKGGASRFFYQAKVSKQERNMGLDNFDDKKPDYIPRYSKDSDGNMLRADGSIVKEVINKNTHPTVKPVSLMAYLCRLVTPPNGIVLDPFMGSGSTGIAAQLEGFRFCGMEMDKDYFKIAEARIENFESYRKFLKK